MSRHTTASPLVRRLFEPVDIAALVYYRIAFGVLMVWNLWFYYRRGFIGIFWIDPKFRFSFPGFSWVQPWPGDGIYYHCLVLAVLAVLMTVGASGKTWVVSPGRYLSTPQARMMMRRPSLLLDFSHFLASEWRKQGYEDVEVRARSLISLNNRTPQWLVDPEVDLASQRLTLRHSPWITPLQEPLPPEATRTVP